MLLNMKAYVEAMRSLLYYIGYLLSDKIAAFRCRGKKRASRESSGPADSHLPRAMSRDKASKSAALGMQVYGGYGYIKEYPQEQLLRDCRITMIYEGTNGIQAMDLLGRKLGMNKGKPIMDLMGEIQKIIAQAKKHDSPSKAYAEIGWKKHSTVWRKWPCIWGPPPCHPKVMNAFAFAHPFLEASGDVVMGWMLLWRAVIGPKSPGKAKKERPVLLRGADEKRCSILLRRCCPSPWGKWMPSWPIAMLP
jgi:hypothetical protein